MGRSYYNDMLDRAFQCAYRLMYVCDQFKHCVELLDALDTVMCQYMDMSWWKSVMEPVSKPHHQESYDIIERKEHWTEVIFDEDLNLSFPYARRWLKSFLELMVLRRLYPYVIAKLHTHVIEQARKQNLLHLAIQYRGWWRNIVDENVYSAELLEVLFQAGADPNIVVTNEGDDTLSQTSFSPWTFLLHTAHWECRASRGYTFWRRWKSAVKVFLKYGADPIVHLEDQMIPDSVIDMLATHIPDLIEDWNELRQLFLEAREPHGV
jgi:hypothetical protein